MLFYPYAGRSRRDDQRWHELRCPCGAEWRWYGRPVEGALLERLWARHHQPHGLRIST
jgi:hypothetical protein